MKKLSFEDWYDEYESKVEEKLKMDGRYYELCFDSEKEFDDEYDKYIEINSNKDYEKYLER